MVSRLKYRLMSGWTLMRFVRLGLATLVIIQSVINSEMLFASLGGILLFQALFNYGCCGASGCNVNQNTKETNANPATIKEISYKEIK
ncbi:MAG: hypothetical protein SFY56_15885 [Bacteroidota bacterium]|nr:hypothetical protein [Bacteroidota bacterium]